MAITKIKSVAVVLNSDDTETINMVNLFKEKYKKEIEMKIVMKKDTAIKTIRNIHEDGINNIITAFNSNESLEIENYVKNNKSILLIDTFSTSPELKNINNLLYFLPDDNYMAEYMSLLFDLRKKEIDEIIIIYNNNSWGTNYKEKIKEFTKNKNIHEFGYSTMNQNLIDEVKSEMGGITDDYFIVLLSYPNETKQYINLIKDENKFSVYHFSGDPNALDDEVCELWNNNMSEDFECVFYNGNEMNSKKVDLLNENDINPRKPFFYLIMDAIYSHILSKRYKKNIREILNHYYGYTNKIQIPEEKNRRIFGSCHSIKTIKLIDQNIWYTASTGGSPFLIKIDEYKNSINTKIVDCDLLFKLNILEDIEYEEISINFKNLYGNEYNICVTDLTDIEIPISLYLYIIAGEHKFFIPNSLSNNEVKKIDGIFDNEDYTIIVIVHEKPISFSIGGNPTDYSGI